MHIETLNRFLKDTPYFIIIAPSDLGPNVHDDERTTSEHSPRPRKVRLFEVEKLADDLFCLRFGDRNKSEEMYVERFPELKRATLWRHVFKDDDTNAFEHSEHEPLYRFENIDLTTLMFA
jgi:hypothetical protein